LPADNDDDTVNAERIIIGINAEEVSRQFIEAIMQHRFWDGEVPGKVPA
jgi:catalase